MEDKQIRILGIILSDQSSDAKEFQYTLTKYGCSIKTRMGINLQENKAGLLLLELTGIPTEMDNLEAALGKLAGAQVRRMTFE